MNHYFAKRLGFYEDAADATNSKFNMAVLLAWLITAVPGLYMILAKGVFAAYLVIPAWIASVILPTDSSIWARAENRSHPVALHPLMLQTNSVLDDIERRFIIMKNESDDRAHLGS